MCEQGELVWMPELGPHGRYIDKCMEGRIKALRGIGIETLGCCCGHGKYTETIIVESELTEVFDGIEVYNAGIFKYNTQMWIERTRRFYLTDDEGLYYIPEVVNAGN